MFTNRIVLVLLAISATGCTTGYPERITLRPSDADVFLDEKRIGGWSNPVGEYQYDMIDSIYKRANDKQESLSAIVITQQGFHPIIYSLFRPTLVVVNFLYWGSHVGKGTASYSSNELESIIISLENSDRCADWSATKPADILGDVLVYQQSSGLRVCLNRDAFFGGPAEIREWFWNRFESNINWTHYTYGKQ